MYLLQGQNTRHLWGSCNIKILFFNLLWFPLLMRGGGTTSSWIYCCFVVDLLSAYFWMWFRGKSTLRGYFVCYGKNSCRIEIWKSADEKILQLPRTSSSYTQTNWLVWYLLIIFSDAGMKACWFGKLCFQIINFEFLDALWSLVNFIMLCH